MIKPVKFLVTVLFVFLLLLLQTTVVDYIKIFGIIPNLLLTATVCYALCTADLRGIIFGVICGMLLDITGGRAIGINSLLCTYVSFVCVWTCDKLYNNNSLVAAASTGVITVCYGLVVFITNFLIWGKTGIFYSIWRIIIPEAIYSAAGALVIYPIADLVANGPKRKSRRLRRKSGYLI